MHLDLKEGVMPKIFKPRPVPSALKAKVEEELDRLVKLKIYEPVTHSEWEAPVGPVLKPMVRLEFVVITKLQSTQMPTVISIQSQEQKIYSLL